MAPGTLKISVNIAAADNAMSARVQKTTIFVSSSLAAAEGLADPLTGLTGGVMTLSPPTEWKAEGLRPSFRQWVLSAGFREIADAIATLLEEYHKVAVLWSVLPASMPRSLTGAEWQKEFAGPLVRFHKLGLPDKLAALEALGVVPDARDAARLRAINAVRNCLVHRQGVVGPKDVDATGDLRLIGLQMNAYVHQKDGSIEPINELPFLVDAGCQVEFREEDFIRAFRPGSSVDIDAEAFNAAAMALIFTGGRMRDLMQKHGVRQGQLKGPEQQDTR